MTPTVQSIANSPSVAAPTPASAPAKQTKAVAAAPEPALRTNAVEVPKKTTVDLEEGMKKIEDIVQRMNQEMQSQKRGLSFSFDRAINTHVVTVTSVNSGEVIRQIPTEAVVRVAHNIEKLKGVLFDGKY